MRDVAGKAGEARMGNQKRDVEEKGGGQELLWMAGVATAVKALMIPCYRSSDFEVHRHWLALTHSLPFSAWYTDETSPWTLDYPPLFAWFEKFLALFAHFVDPKITNLVQGLNYDAITAVVVQRLSVMAADGVLFYALWRLGPADSPRQRRLVFLCVAWSPALLMVDHVHFQYNGFLLGMLLLSIALVSQGRDLLGGVVFAVLCCFKHLFAVAGPVYAVYLLRHYCKGSFSVAFSRFVALGASVVSVVALAFGPFVYHGQMFQVLKRLFPFGRGLCHAYWAPNFWVFYNVLDKFLTILLRRLGFAIHVEKASLTGGLVGDSSKYAVLPQVTPTVSLILVLLALLPCLVRIWQNPVQCHFAQWVSYAYACGFMFGWHVHEKASLHFVIPLSLVSMQSLEHARHYLLLMIVSCYSMFPLLYEDKEYPVKLLLLGIHGVLAWRSFLLYFSCQRLKAQGRDNHSEQESTRSLSFPLKALTYIEVKSESKLVGKIGWIYLSCLLLNELFGKLVHPYYLKEKLPFLPLMLQSVCCALGMGFSYIFQLTCILLSK